MSCTLDVVAHSGCPGQLPSSCLWTQGVERAWLGAAVLLAMLCSAGPSRVRERDWDVTGAQVSPTGLMRGHPQHKRQVNNERKIRESYKAWKKEVCLIFSKRQVVLWMVRKRRFPWLYNNSLKQPRVLQWWHLNGCFFFNKVHFFRTGTGKLVRIAAISLMLRKVGTSNLLTYFSWRSNSIFIGRRPASYLGEAQFSRLDTVPLSYLSLFLPQGPSLSILSVLKSLIKK